MYKPENIIVVGGNAAGPAAAAKAKRVNPNANVMMFEAGSFISTGTCELPYVLSGEIEDYRNIVFFDAETFKQKKGVSVFTNHLVESVNRRSKEIFVRDLKSGVIKSQKYDSLVMATGSNAVTLPQFSIDLENVFYLKKVSNLVSIKEYLNQNDIKTAAVIGSGYIGLEAAEAFHKLGIEIKVFEKAPMPMPGSEPEVQEFISDLLSENGIEFFGDSGDIKYLTENNRVKKIRVGSRLIEIDLIIVSAGVSPNTELAVSTGIEIGRTGAIQTDRKQKTSDYSIFAAGDNAEIINAVTNRPDYLPIATLAHMNGHIAGENAAGGNIFSRPVVKNVAVKLFDNVLVSVGLGSEQTELLNSAFKTVSAEVPSIVKVMPEAGNLFGKLIYENNSRQILGAAFFGKGEVTGYGNIIALMIKNRIKTDELGNTDYNYTPPVSPFVNILSVLSRKISR